MSNHSVELIPIEEVVAPQKNPANSIFSIIPSILFRYGSADIIAQNAIVKSTLLLLSSVLSFYPPQQLEATTLHACWMAVLFVLVLVLDSGLIGRTLKGFVRPRRFRKEAGGKMDA